MPFYAFFKIHGLSDIESIVLYAFQYINVEHVERETRLELATNPASRDDSTNFHTERETRLELATNSLEGCDSTN